MAKKRTAGVVPARERQPSLTPVWREIQSSALWSSIMTVGGCGVI